MSQDIYFGLDTILNFNTGYYDKGVLIMKRKQIILTYLKTWFILDFFAVLPYSYVIDYVISQEQGDNSSKAFKTPQLLRMLKIIRFVRILRIIRIFKLGKLMYKLEECIVTETLTTIVDSLKLLTIILYVCHWLACTFFFVGSFESASEPIWWITKNNIIDEDLWTQYSTSFYWAITTMATVGYGDITPSTNNEKLFVMLAMTISWGVFAYSVGSIGTIVNRPNLLSTEFRAKMLHINQFMLKKSIPNRLRLKIMSYLDYLFEYKKEYKLDETEALEMLNENLRDQVIAYMNGNLLNKTGVFQVFSVVFLSQITFKMKTHTFSIDDPIFEEGSIGNKLYYISKGSSVIIHKETHTFIHEMSIDDSFGELSFFSEKPRRCTVRSK